PYSSFSFFSLSNSGVIFLTSISSLISFDLKVFNFFFFFFRFFTSSSTSYVDGTLALFLKAARLVSFSSLECRLAIAILCLQTDSICFFSILVIRSKSSSCLALQLSNAVFAAAKF
ncbi:hypothetical protein PMAYCL1PPCAC_25926, partial [Pristionchus mayeri]